ncbi:MAG: hypothetical protein LBJ76_05250 [Candidatus Accumulibacter sp.]|nr:hypothetical protein [Accumulibacter sp.]
MSDNTRRTALLSAIVFSLGFAGCDDVLKKAGVQTASAQAEADSLAVGGACRQSGRAIEDCYSIYSWLVKSKIYDGWRDMDAYMRENNLETVPTQLPPMNPPPPPPPPPPPSPPKRKKPRARQAQAAADSPKTSDAASPAPQ